MRKTTRHTVAIKQGNGNVNVVNTKIDKLEKISIIIPAAGIGTRMKSYGPKPLLHINDKSLIDHQLDVIGQKIRVPYEVILVAGYEASRVFKNTPHNIIKVENEFYQETNVVRSIGLGLHACTTENVLLIYGDLVFNPQTLDVQFDHSWLLTNTYMPENEVGCTTDEGYVVNLSYDLPIKWSQIGYFTKKEFKLLQNTCHKRENDQFFGFEIINNIISHGGKFLNISPTESKINDMDSSKDLQTINNIIGHENSNTTK